MIDFYYRAIGFTICHFICKKLGNQEFEKIDKRDLAKS